MVSDLDLDVRSLPFWRERSQPITHSFMGSKYGSDVNVSQLFERAAACGSQAVSLTYSQTPSVSSSSCLSYSLLAQAEEANEG